MGLLWLPAAPFGMSDFRKLSVWRKAHALALNVHRATAQVRGSGAHSLRSALSRASLSIPTNIVEGSSQTTREHFGKFVRLALNATAELEYQLMVARDTRKLSAVSYDSLSSQTLAVKKMLHGLLGYLMKPKGEQGAEKGRPA
jgi:four helix bundle protein